MEPGRLRGRSKSLRGPGEVRTPGCHFEALLFPSIGVKGLRTEQRVSTHPGNQKILLRKLLSKDSTGPRGEPRKEAGGSEVPS